MTSNNSEWIKAIGKKMYFSEKKPVDTIYAVIWYLNSLELIVMDFECHTLLELYLNS